MMKQNFTITITFDKNGIVNTVPVVGNESPEADYRVLAEIEPVIDKAIKKHFQGKKRGFFNFFKN